MEVKHEQTRIHKECRADRRERFGRGGDKKGKRPDFRFRAKKSNIKNILFLLVDQQRQDCLACYGNPIVQTPNLDRLAQNGIQFNNMFTPTALCSPARTSLQTGLWPHNTQVMFNTANGGRSGGVKDSDPSIPYFSQLMKKDRWQLGHIGKWRIGTEKNKPSDRGYECVYYPAYGLPSHIYGPRPLHGLSENPRAQRI